MKSTQYPPQSDLQIRWKNVQQAMKIDGADACIISSNVNIYYLTGQLFNGYVYLPIEGDPLYFVRRPEGMKHPFAQTIRKAEDMPALIQEMALTLPQFLFLEADQLTYNEYIRLQAVFNPKKTGNATQLLRMQRMIKTPWEVEQLRISGKIHSEAYSKITSCYRPGISDIELQSNLEREMRLLGSIGLFRAFGSNMDIYMGSLLTGGNAETPSPFDFALGGEGMHPSLPIGANGTLLQSGKSIMVDLAGNYTAYITDMTRVFSIGKLPERAYEAHQLSINIHNWLQEQKIGSSCAEIYNHSLQMVEKAGWSEFFMGTKQKAKFVGHGVGVEINELPVLMGRSHDILQQGMAIAFEPKFVLPGIGAVGIENTYLVTDQGIEKLTNFEEQIITL